MKLDAGTIRLFGRPLSPEDRRPGIGVVPQELAVYMSPTMQRIGLVTINAWALDGYIAVFWRGAPIAELLLPVLVLSSLTVVFLAGARLFARRWETL